MKALLRRWAWAVPCLMGAGAFLVVVGPDVLDPTSIAWLRDEGDSFTHYLGWAFFRNSPWTMPLGANPNYGLELGSSIVYSDSIPLLALLFKPLSPWLPPVFQYTGLWLFACFVLQALAGWHLVGLATSHAGLRLAGSALFLLSPPMLFRLSGHWALVGHWMVVAALGLALRPGRHRQLVYWVVLTVVASLVHMYLLAMIAAIWLAAWLRDLWCHARTAPVLFLELLLVPASIGMALWQAGFFMVGNGKAGGGFGAFRLNLNAPINPMGWSRVLPSLPVGGADYEGFAYLGLGALLLVPVALYAAVRLRARGDLTLRLEWLPLAAALLALTAIAASNRVAFGEHVFTYPLPPWAESTVGLLRASGRLFWPVFYVLLFAMVAAIVRAYPARVSGTVLVVALAVQALDISVAWKTYGPRFRRPAAIRSPLTSAFWEEAPSMYRRIRLVPAGNHTGNWAVFAEYAQRHGLATDAAYTARIDAERWSALSRTMTSALVDGTFDHETLFVLQGGTARRIACVIDSTRDQIASVDGFWVLMPNWKGRHGDRYAGQLRLTCPVLSPDGEPLAFVSGNDSPATLLRGWSMPEPWGTWSEGRRSLILLHVRGAVSRLDFTAAPAVRPGPPLEVRVFVDGQLQDTWRLEGREPRVCRLTLPDALARRRDLRRLQVPFEFSDTRSPESLGTSHDRRPIALALHQVRAVD